MSIVTTNWPLPPSAHSFGLQTIGGKFVHCLPWCLISIFWIWLIRSLKSFQFNGFWAVSWFILIWTYVCRIYLYVKGILCFYREVFDFVRGHKWMQIIIHIWDYIVIILEPLLYLTGSNLCEYTVMSFRNSAVFEMHYTYSPLACLHDKLPDFTEL